MKVDMSYYIQQINQLVQQTEEIGETLNEHFMVLRSAIDKKTTDQLEKEQLEEISNKFAKGVATYKNIYKQLLQMRAPVKVIGIHKKLEKNYDEYIKGCQQMLDSIDTEKNLLDVEAFNQAEKIQDEATNGIAFCIKRITTLALKN